MDQCIVALISAMEGALEQCCRGSTGAVQWMYDGSSALDDNWKSALEGRVGSNRGSNGEMHWREARSSELEGALEPCSRGKWKNAMEGRVVSHRGRNGAVLWMKDWRSELEEALEQCHGGKTGEPCRQEWGNALEGGLEQCSGGNTGGVPWRDQEQCSGMFMREVTRMVHWSSAVEIALEQCH